jgi:hypothetical protein
MKVVNLTPHAITIGDHSFAPSGIVARVSTNEVECAFSDTLGVPVAKRMKGEVIFGCDILDNGTMYIVSSMVLDALPANTDYTGIVVAPDTGATAIRNDKGHIVAVTRVITK